MLYKVVLKYKKLLTLCKYTADLRETTKNKWIILSKHILCEEPSKFIFLQGLLRFVGWVNIFHEATP